MRKVPHPTLEERTAQGRDARKATPRSSHEGWEPAADRSDPVALEVQGRVLDRDASPPTRAEQTKHHVGMRRGLAR
jgi:hypothetical protein